MLMCKNYIKYECTVPSDEIRKKTATVWSDERRRAISERMNQKGLLERANL